MSTESFISVQEAARRLGVTDAWVIRMIEKKVLIGYRLNGRAWAVSRASVENNAKSYRHKEHSGRPRKLG